MARNNKVRITEGTNAVLVYSLLLRENGALPDRSKAGVRISIYVVLPRISNTGFQSALFTPEWKVRKRENRKGIRARIGYRHSVLERMF